VTTDPGTGTPTTTVQLEAVPTGWFARRALATTIASIESKAYCDPSYHEGAKVWRKRMREPARKENRGRYLLVLVRSGRDIVGYGLAVLWQKDACPPPLGWTGLRFPAIFDELFAHDVAVLPGYTGKVGLRIAELYKKAGLERGLGRIRCIAVNCSKPKWEAIGFTEIGPAPDDYGNGSVMVLDLRAPDAR
jgi:hypothetical protein